MVNPRPFAPWAEVDKYSIKRIMDPPPDLSERVRQTVESCRARRPSFAVPPGGAQAALLALVEKAPDPVATLAGLHADDLYLAFACAQGDAAALAEFDARVLLPAVRAAADVDGSPDFADEVAQAVRSRLLTAGAGQAPRVATYAGRAPLESWTRAVALRAANSLRGAARAERTVVDDRLAELASGDTAERDLMHAELRREFRACFGAALASLDGRSRGVLRLHVIEGVTLDGLATAYGVHRATVARWLATARSALLKRTRARLAVLLHVPPEEVDSLIEQARSRLDISISRFLEPRPGE